MNAKQPLGRADLSNWLLSVTARRVTACARIGMQSVIAAATCHLASNGLSFSSGSARALFASSRGTNPLFAAVDGANCPTAPSGDAASRSLLLNNGLIRVGLTMPASANFTIETLDDPYGCADVIDPVSGQRTLSVYRRPLPTTNLRFLSAVMWDGRETVSPLNNSNTFQANLVTDLRHQAIDATLGHAQAAAAPSGEQVSAIVNFELALFSAQNTDATAGSLQALGASGGPVTLSRPTGSATLGSSSTTTG